MMSAQTTGSATATPLVACLRLGGHWRARVLLRFSDPVGLLGQSWPDVTAADWLEALAEPEELFRTGGEVELLKDSRSSMVVRRRLPLGNARPEVFCKLSRRRNLLRKLFGLFRRTRPSRNWQIGWDLLAGGISTALPLAVLEKRIFGLRLVAIIITQSLLPGKTLERFVREDAPALACGQQRRLTAELAELIRRLHDHDFFHRDLKGVNIFVHSGNASNLRFYVLDLDGCGPHGQAHHKKAKSLGRLARASLGWPVIHRTDRLRFLRAYLAGPSGDARNGQAHSWADWKNWWCHIDDQVRRKSRSRSIR